MQNDERRGMAYHEAGHAVVALEVGCEVDVVYIDNGGRAGGGTRSNCDYRHMPFRDRLALCYAGEVAQTKFRAPTRAWAAADDQSLRATLVYGLPEDVADKLLQQGKLRAEEVLEQYTRNVERIAAYLMTHDRIDRSNLTRLFLGNEQPPA